MRRKIASPGINPSDLVSPRKGGRQKMENENPAKKSTGKGTSVMPPDSPVVQRSSSKVISAAKQSEVTTESSSSGKQTEMTLEPTSGKQSEAVVESTGNESETILELSGKPTPLRRQMSLRHLDQPPSEGSGVMRLGPYYRSLLRNQQRRRHPRPRNRICLDSLHPRSSLLRNQRR